METLYLIAVLFLVGMVAYLHYRVSEVSKLANALAQSVLIYGLILRDHSKDFTIRVETEDGEDITPKTGGEDAK